MPLNAPFLLRQYLHPFANVLEVLHPGSAASAGFHPRIQRFVDERYNNNCVIRHLICGNLADLDKEGYLF